MSPSGRSVALAVALAGAAFFGLNLGPRVITTPIPSPPSAASSPTGAGLASRREPPDASPAESEKNAPWKTEWPRLLAQPASPEREASLAAALDLLRTTPPDAATQQFLALEPSERESVVAFRLAEAAQRSSDAAVRDAIGFCDEDPARALEYGRSLIFALAKNGDFPAALSFVLAEDSVDGWLGENGHKWLTALFVSWAAADPKQAMHVAQESVGANYRGEALQVVSAVWAQADPASAANFAWELPPSTDRDRALAIVLQEWSDTDAAKASAWLAVKSERTR
jgi:hypothetical protein